MSLAKDIVKNVVAEELSTKTSQPVKSVSAPLATKTSPTSSLTSNQLKTQLSKYDPLGLSGDRMRNQFYTQEISQTQKNKILTKPTISTTEFITAKATSKITVQEPLVGTKTLQLQKPVTKTTSRTIQLQTPITGSVQLQTPVQEQATLTKPQLQTKLPNRRENAKSLKLATRNRPQPVQTWQA